MEDGATSSESHQLAPHGDDDDDANGDVRERTILRVELVTRSHAARSLATGPTLLRRVSDILARRIGRGERRQRSTPIALLAQQQQLQRGAK